MVLHLRRKRSPLLRQMGRLEVASAVTDGQVARGEVTSGTR